MEKKPCPKCGTKMLPGNLAQHITKHRREEERQKAYEEREATIHKVDKKILMTGEKMKSAITLQNCRYAGGSIISGNCILSLPRNPADIDLDLGPIIDEDGNVLKIDCPKCGPEEATIIRIIGHDELQCNVCGHEWRLI